LTGVNVAGRRHEHRVIPYDDDRPAHEALFTNDDRSTKYNNVK